MSFASLNHFLKLRIEKPTTSPLAGLTLRKKSFSTSLEIAFSRSPIEISRYRPFFYLKWNVDGLLPK
jgi:hypothetical protein